MAKDVTMSLRLTQEGFDKLQELGEETDLGMSGVVRKAITVFEAFHEMQKEGGEIYFVDSEGYEQKVRLL